MSGLRLLRDARATGVTVAAIDYLLSLGYSLTRARVAVDPRAMRRRARVAQLDRLIQVEQGRARARLLDGEDAYRIALRAVEEGAWFDDGGIPGSAYKDRWETTHVSAVLDVEQGVVHVAVARDGGRTAPFGLNRNFDRSVGAARARTIADALASARRWSAVQIPLVELAIEGEVS